MKEHVYHKVGKTAAGAFWKRGLSPAFFHVFFAVALMLTVFSVQSADASCNWSGVWDLTMKSGDYEGRSAVTMQQNGAQLTVNIDLSGSGEPSVGTISGDTARFFICTYLNGECVRPGHYVWTIQPDCNHFTGYCEWEDKGPCITTFSGTRVTAPNQPPEVTLDYYPILPVEGKLLTFSADAFDADGDELAYQWFLDGALQASIGSEFQWTNPSMGAHTVRVTVSDGKGGSAEDVVEIQVNATRRYIIAPGLQEGEGQPWGTVYKIFLDGKEITDFAKTPLYTGSQVKTGPGVEILIRDSGGVKTRIEESTQFEVTVKESGGPTRQEVYERLIKGIVGFYRPPGYEAQKKFQLETRRAITSPKGTTFSVSNFFDVTTVEVEEGIVEVTDSETEVVSALEAGEELSIGTNCVPIDDDLSIFLSCAEYDEVGYSFTLDYFQNPNDPDNLYWKMDMSTFVTVMETDCIPVGGDVSLHIPCGEYAGIEFSFTLDYYPNPNDPFGVYWKMDLNTLKFVQRAVPVAQSMS